MSCHFIFRSPSPRHFQEFAMLAFSIVTKVNLNKNWTGSGFYVRIVSWATLCFSQEKIRCGHHFWIARVKKYNLHRWRYFRDLLFVRNWMKICKSMLVILKFVFKLMVDRHNQLVTESVKKRTNFLIMMEETLRTIQMTKIIDATVPALNSSQLLYVLFETLMILHRKLNKSGCKISSSFFCDQL
jgi:hypothetical protein